MRAFEHATAGLATIARRFDQSRNLAQSLILAARYALHGLTSRVAAGTQSATSEIRLR